MRTGLVILALMLSGCASTVASRPAERVYTDRTTATAQPAAALVYDPPVVLAEGPALDLSREGRDEAAYLGYEDGRTTFFYIHQDDHQLNYGFLGRRGRFGGSGGYFERQAVSDTVGVRYR